MILTHNLPHNHSYINFYEASTIVQHTFFVPRYFINSLDLGLTLVANSTKDRTETGRDAFLVG